MNPRDARTPAELFGEVLGDPRALRRAYARLVKQHGPETDPDTFAHIRRLYEQSLATASAAETTASAAETAAPDGARTAPDGARTASAAEAAAPGATTSSAAPAAGLTAPDPVDALIDGATAETLPAVLAALRDLLATTGGAPALDAALGLQRALDPAGVPDVLALGGAHPALHDRVLGQVGGVLALMPTLASHPGFDRLFESLAAPAHRLLLARQRVQALLVRGRRTEALALYRRVEPELHALPAADWLPLFQTVVAGCAWELEAHERDAAHARLGDAALPLEDAAHDELEELLLVAAEHDAAAADPVLPAPLRDLAPRLHHQPAAVRVALLARLAAEVPDLPGAVAHLAVRWPGLHAATWQAVHRLTGLHRYLVAWHQQGSPPTRYTPAVWRPLEAATATVSAAQEVVDAAARRLDRWRYANVACGTVLMLLSVTGAMLLGVDAELILKLGLVGGVVAIAAGEYTVIPRIRRALVEARARREATADLTAAIAAHARATGLWPHELAGAAAQQDHGVLAAPLDWLVEDLAALPSLASDEHIRRAAWAERMARLEAAHPPPEDT